MLGNNTRRSLLPGKVGDTPLLAKSTKQVKLDYAEPPVDVRWSTRVSADAAGAQQTLNSSGTPTLQSRPSTVEEIQ